MAKTIVWRSGERLLVAVGASPFSTQLVRWTRRLAAAQGASWIAVHIETSRPLDASAQAVLDRNLALARELGAGASPRAHPVWRSSTDGCLSRRFVRPYP